MKFLIIVEKADSNYSAYAPDIPGCIAAGATLEQTKALMAEAIGLHLQGLQEDGQPIPQPNSQAFQVEVKSPSL